MFLSDVSPCPCLFCSLHAGLSLLKTSFPLSFWYSVFSFHRLFFFFSFSFPPYFRLLLFLSIFALCSVLSPSLLNESFRLPLMPLNSLFSQPILLSHLLFSAARFRLIFVLAHVCTIFLTHSVATKQFYLPSRFTSLSSLYPIFLPSYN